MRRLGCCCASFCAALGTDLLTILAAFGKAFNDARYVSIIWIVLPVVGLLATSLLLSQYTRSEDDLKLWPSHIPMARWVTTLSIKRV